MLRSRRKIPLKTLKKLKALRLPILFVLAGLVLILFPYFYKQSSQASVKKIEITSKKTQTSTGPIKIASGLLSKKETTQSPQRILIPKYKLDLPIIEAKVLDGFWELSESSASHGVGSGNPGEKGNIVVFAHARDELFGPIRDIKEGDAIYLLTKNSWHEYRVSETKLVDPNQVEVIAPTPKETLTLFTCSGFLDSKRLIVTAKPN